MFLLVSGRHVGAHPDGHQHGVSIQISVNLGKKFFRISCIRKIVVTRILARVLAYLPSFTKKFITRLRNNIQGTPTSIKRPTPIKRPPPISPRVAHCTICKPKIIAQREKTQVRVQHYSIYTGRVGSGGLVRDNNKRQS